MFSNEFSWIIALDDKINIHSRKELKLWRMT